jgi:hypothetical protein
VRALKRFLMIAGGCLAVLGLGLYANHQAEVHGWLRAFGSRAHTPDEIVVRQRSTINLPGLEGAVRLRVGDIKRGLRAEIEILGPGLVILAAHRAAEVGDRIRFVLASQSYELHVLKYVDEIGSGDFATFRLINTFVIGYRTSVNESGNTCLEKGQVLQRIIVDF